MAGAIITGVLSIVFIAFAGGFAIGLALLITAGRKYNAKQNW